jgi:arylamine N-acetyltransferase
MDDGIRPRVPHTPARNHLLLLAKPGHASMQTYLVDVGFGLYSPQGPLVMTDGCEATLGTTTFQLRKRLASTPVAGLHLHELWGIDPALEGWTRFYSFSRSQLINATDVLVVNHWVTTHPDSVFAVQPFCMFRRGDNAYTLMKDTVTSTTYRNGVASKTTTEVTSATQLCRLADTCLDIELTHENAVQVMNHSRAPASHFAPRPQPCGPLRQRWMSPGVVVGAAIAAAIVGVGIGYHLRDRGISPK